MVYVTETMVSIKAPKLKRSATTKSRRHGDAEEKQSEEIQYIYRDSGRASHARIRRPSSVSAEPVAVERKGTVRRRVVSADESRKHRTVHGHGSASSPRRRVSRSAERYSSAYSHEQQTAEARTDSHRGALTRRHSTDGRQRGDGLVVLRSPSVREPLRIAPRLSLRRSNTSGHGRIISTREVDRTPTRSSPRIVEKKRERVLTPAPERRRSAGLFSSFFGPPQSPRAPEKRVECLTCMADDVPVSKSAKLGCGHIMCHDCLKRIFVLSVTDPQHMPPRCCGADHIPLKHVDKLFSVKFKMQWNRKYQEYTTKNRIYCPAKGCGDWIKPANIRTDPSGGKYGKCSRCKTKVCCVCNERWHGGRDCPKDEDTTRFVEVARREGWQRCHNCSAMVELKEGCNHMTCRCTAEFCMICGAKWKTCTCPWFNYEQVEADRLGHMNVPMPVPAPAIDAPHAPPLHVYEEELRRRRQQEEEDELLARRLQEMNFDHHHHHRHNHHHHHDAHAHPHHHHPHHHLSPAGFETTGVFGLGHVHDRYTNGAYVAVVADDGHNEYYLASDLPPPAAEMHRRPLAEDDEVVEEIVEGVVEEEEDDDDDRAGGRAWPRQAADARPLRRRQSGARMRSSAYASRQYTPLLRAYSNHPPPAAPAPPPPPSPSPPPLPRAEERALPRRSYADYGSDYARYMPADRLRRAASGAGVGGAQRRRQHTRRLSTLAGLSRNHGQQGGRVGAWLQHVEDGPPVDDLSSIDVSAVA